MAYLALYRRFRPDGFEKVIGQDAIVKTLTNQIKSDKIGHAYLFCGARGTGKTTLAKIFAKAVNCLNTVDGSPCGKCEACLNLQNPSNLNVIEMDAASNNKVENVRSIRENVQFPPVGVKYKVYIIDEVHMLTTEAFNALLKTLEEPPKHAVFILATTEPHKLPATILSRCMRFDFRLVSTERIASLISTIYDEIGKKYTKEAVIAIAKAGEGSVRDALSVADLCVSVGDGELKYSDVISVLGATDSAKINSLTASILSGNVGEVLKLSAELSSLGKSVGLTCKELVNYVRDLTVIKSVGDAKDILNVPNDVYLDMQKTADLTDNHGLLRVLEILSVIENDIRYSTQPRAVFETALIKASMPKADYDLDALLARISKIENTLNEIKNSGGITVKAQPQDNSELIKEIENLKNEILTLKQNAIKIEKAEPVKLVNVEKFEEVKVEEKVKTPKKVTEFDDLVPPEEGDVFIPELTGYSFAGSNEAESENVEVSVSKTIEKVEVKQEVKQEVKPEIKIDAPPSNVNVKRVWGSVVRKLRTLPGKTILWVACQEMTAELVGNNFVIDAGGESEKKVLLKEENLKTLTDLILEFGNFNVVVKGEQMFNAQEENVTEKLNKFFGEENVEIKN